MLAIRAPVGVRGFACKRVLPCFFGSTTAKTCKNHPGSAWWRTAEVRLQRPLFSVDVQEQNFVPNLRPQHLNAAADFSANHKTMNQVVLYFTVSEIIRSHSLDWYFSRDSV